MTSSVPDVLEAARPADGALLDLTVRDPSRCGLAWPAVELAALLSPAMSGETPRAALVLARRVISLPDDADPNGVSAVCILRP